MARYVIKRHLKTEQLLYRYFTLSIMIVFLASMWIVKILETPEEPDKVRLFETVYEQEQYIGTQRTISVHQISRQVDIENLLKVVEAEAGNQDDLGKAYVCDVILNRVDTGRWGDTIDDIIYYPNAFSVVSNGTIDNIEVSEGTYKVVCQELQNRTNTEVLAFRTGNYHSGNTPLFQHGDHYFSK